MSDRVLSLERADEASRPRGVASQLGLATFATLVSRAADAELLMLCRVFQASMVRRLVHTQRKIPHELVP